MNQSRGEEDIVLQQWIESQVLWVAGRSHSLDGLVNLIDENGKRVFLAD